MSLSEQCQPSEPSSSSPLQYQSQVSTDSGCISGNTTTTTSQPPLQHNNQRATFSIFSSSVDPFTSSFGAAGLDLAGAQTDIDRSQSLLADSAYSLLFKSDRLRRKKNLKKANKLKRNSLQVFDTVTIANVASQFQTQNYQQASAPVSSNVPPGAAVAPSSGATNAVSNSMLPYNTPTCANNTMDVAAPAMAPVSAIQMDAHHRLPAAEANVPVPVPVVAGAQPIKRNVIIQRDSRGYGIRISGDNPVSIESVNPEGAAYRAGVRNGDRIIKVNGTLVTKLSHADVVRMIQNCGSFVGLTLLANPNGVHGVHAAAAPIELSTSPQANSPTPPIAVSPGSHLSVVPTTSSGATSPNSMAPLGPPASSSVQITLPQQAPESTVQSYQNNQIKTLRMMIDAQEGLIKSTKLSDKDKAEATRVIEELKRKLAELVTAHNNHFDPGSSASLPTRLPIITMDSDYEDNVGPSPGPSGIPVPSSDLSDYALVPPEDDILPHLTSNGLSSKSPPSKSTSFLSKIPGSSKSKRDSSRFSLNSGLLSTGVLTAPVITSLGLGAISPGSSTSSSLLPVTMENIHLHSLRFARFLINNISLPPHPMLFYVVTKHIFPVVVANATSIVERNSNRAGGGAETSGLRTLIQRWAHQIMATWICNETPLFFQEFPPDSLEAFDQKLGAFITTVSAVGSTGVAANPFESPFLEKAHEIVSKQLTDFQAALQLQPELLATQPKADLQATVEQLLLGAPPGAPTGSDRLRLDLAQVDYTVDQFIGSAIITGNSHSHLATISSLLTIGHFVFGITSKHLLLSDPQNCISLLMNTNAGSLLTATPPIAPSPVATNPVLKLSSESSSSANKGKHKRIASLPAQSKPTMNGTAGPGADLFLTSGATTGISDSGHLFVQVNEMTTVKYCSGCHNSLWGDLYNYRCPKCLMFVHLWCIKTSAPANPCENLDQAGSLLPSGVSLRTQSTREPSRKKQKLKDKKTSMIERFAGKAFQRPSTADVNTTSNLNRSTSSLTSSSSSSFGADTISCSSSSDFDEDHSSGVATSHSGTLDEDGKMAGSAVTSPVQGVSAVGTMSSVCGIRAPLPNRSGSFNQRKKTKNSSHGSTPRKRSDPALTSRHMSTITGAISGSIDSPTPPTLTSAQSSGALLNYSTSMPQGGAADPNGSSALQHQTSVPSGPFRPLNKGQAAKKMTASDSSLMSATISINASSNFSNQSSINLSSTCPSPRTHARRERKDRKKTADSAIVCNTSDSETDETAPLTVKSPDEAYGYDNESIQVTNIDDPGAAYREAAPPPLPPRPVSEKRRQIKAEIVESELNHYETLRYIRNVYQRPFRKERIFTDEHLDAIFGNTKKLKSTHKKIYKEMRASHSSDRDMFDTGSLEKALKEVFSGEIGRDLERQAADFVKNHKLGGGMEIFNQRKKDSRLKALFDNELKAKEMPDCRWSRLSLQDLLGSVFQRPLRYPLLLERLLNATPKDTSAYAHLVVALDCSKKIANQINEDMRRADLDARLKDIVKSTDCANFDRSRSILEKISNQVLIHEGPLVWRVTKAKFIDVLLILTNSMLLVLTRDSSGDRYLLKKHTHPTTKRPLRLDIVMNDLLTRDVATDPTAFFLVSNSQDIFYEFAAQTSNECKLWKDAITSAINEYRKRNPQSAPITKSASRLQDLAPKNTTPESPNITSSSTSTLSSPPVSLLNRPLPKVPTEPPTPQPQPLGLPPSGSPPPPPPPPPPHQAKPEGQPVAGTIQVTEPSERVKWEEVKVANNEPKMHFAGTFQRTDSQERDAVFNDRWKTIGAQISALKDDVANLMVYCDIENHNDSAIAMVKHNMVKDLVELAIKIDHNNRPTLEPFKFLVRKVQTHLQTLNNENTSPNASMNPFDTDPEHLATAQSEAQGLRSEMTASKEVLVSDQEIDDDQRSFRSARSGSGSSNKSQECLQIIEDLADLQISEFQASADKPLPPTSTTSISTSSSLTTTSIESYSTTVVSHEVSTATKLVASSSLNPFDPNNIPELATTSQPIITEPGDAFANPFTSSSTHFDHAQSSTVISSSTVVTSSTTHIISTDLYETTNGMSTSATAFDQLITTQDLADDTIDLNDVNVPPLPSIPPPNVAAQPEPGLTDSGGKPTKSSEAPKSQTFIL